MTRSVAPDESGEPAPRSGQAIDGTALRESMVARLSQIDLAALCADVQQDVAKQGIKLRVEPEMAGGDTKTGTTLNRIDYLETRGFLSYLVDRLQPKYAWVMEEYERRT